MELLLEVLARLGVEGAAAIGLRMRRRLRRLVHGTALTLLAIILVFAWR